MTYGKFHLDFATVLSVGVYSNVQILSNKLAQNWAYATLAIFVYSFF